MRTYQKGGNGSNQHKRATVGIPTVAFEGALVSLADAATKLSVHRATVSNAKKIRAEGSANLIKAVEQGTVSIHAAKDLATLPKNEQEKAVKAGPKAVAAQISEPGHSAGPEYLRYVKTRCLSS